MEVVLRLGGLVRVRDIEAEPVDVDAFALIELVFSMNDEAVIVLAVVDLN